MIHRAFEVSIFCNGMKLDEYGVKEEGPNTMTCFIPSEANKGFSICFGSYFEAASASVRCVIDGRKMGASLCSAGHNGHRWGVRIAEDLRQPFQFSELSLTEEDNTMISDRVLQSIGCIEVSVYRVKKHGRERGGFKSAAVQDIGAVNEKSKKAGSHCVSLGAARRCVAHRRTDSVPFIPGEGCWATFRFLYRPRAILQAQGLLSASQAQQSNLAGPSRHHQRSATLVSHLRPPPSRKRRRSVAGFTPEVEVKPKVGHQGDSSQETNASNVSTNSRPAKRVKRETQPVPFSVGELIDLTDDVKREGSPIRIVNAPVGSVIDLTLEDD